MTKKLRMKIKKINILSTLTMTTKMIPKQKSKKTVQLRQRKKRYTQKKKRIPKKVLKRRTVKIVQRLK